MSDYLLIESRDPFESSDVRHFRALAENLAREGNTVTLFLVQNGVLPARESTESDGLTALAGAGVEILADEFSLAERGISSARLTSGVSPASLEIVVEHLANGRKAIWH